MVKHGLLREVFVWLSRIVADRLGYMIYDAIKMGKGMRRRQIADLCQLSVYLLDTNKDCRVSHFYC